MTLHNCEPGSPRGPLPVVRAQGAAFGYGGQPVLSGLDLEIEPGEVVGVRGCNGSGKSTLLRGLLGLVPQHAGEVWLFGRPSRHPRARRRVGYLPQSQTVSTSLPVTVRELVSSGRRAGLRPWQRFGPADRCAVDCALDGAGLAGLAGRPVTELSGGQQRRALLSRAVATDPDLLLLDEPLAGVDAAGQRLVAATLAGAAMTGTTVLVVLHEPGPLERVLTRNVRLAAPAAGGTVAGSWA